MNKKLLGHEILTSDTAILMYLALVKLVIHLATNGFSAYGFFRDEFYYLACSEHFALGYVDQPPLSIGLLAISRWVLGDSLVAIRFLPALAGAMVVFLTGQMVKELGGKRFAQVTAALSVIAVPMYLGINNLYSMNSFDMVFWALSGYLLILIIKRGDNRLWLLLGLVLGLGLLNKISVLWLGFGLMVGLILTRQRKTLITKGPWLTLLIAALLFLPHILWQIANSWPTLEFIRNATGEKMAGKSPVEFVVDQILIMNPALFPIWLIGLGYYFISQKGRCFSLLGWIYVIVLLLLLINQKSRSGYLAPAYSMLFAAGAIVVERFIHHFKLRWLKPVLIIHIVMGGFFIAPITLPVLPVETYIAYAKRIGMEPSTEEKKEVGKLPQYYADMHGWEKMVETVAGVYHGLSPEEQSQCDIFAGNYGEAGAIDFLGRKYHLPKASSGHNNYWLWGPQNANAQVVIHLGGPSGETLAGLYRKVQVADTFRCEYCMPYENNIPIYLCKEPCFSLKQIWLRMKHYE